MPNRSTNSFNTRCLPVISDYLRRLCVGHYPADVAIKYQDQLLEPNDMYTVFQSEADPDHYFLALGASELANCSKMKIITGSHFLCKTDGREIEVHAGHSQISCLSYHVAYTDDLVRACGVTGQPEAAFTTLHYANIPLRLKSNPSYALGTMATTDICVFLMICMVLLFLVMR